MTQASNLSGTGVDGVARISGPAHWTLRDEEILSGIFLALVALLGLWVAWIVWLVLW